MQVTVIGWLWCDGNPIPGIQLLISFWLWATPDSFPEKEVFLTLPQPLLEWQEQLKAGHDGRETTPQLDAELW